jgi:hypothetical protein
MLSIIIIIIMLDDYMKLENAALCLSCEFGKEQGSCYDV